MQFKDWLENEIPGITDAYESFMDAVLSEGLGLNEQTESLTVQAEFVLEEARKQTPWGS